MITAALAPYMAWAKTRPRPTIDLASSNLLACDIGDLPGARDALQIAGHNDEGFEPLLERIAARYRVTTDRVATATGTSGANFLVYAALVGAGDEVLVEQPGYDPLAGSARLLGAQVRTFERRFEEGYRLDVERCVGSMTPRTRLVVVTNLHNPTGVAAAVGELRALGERALVHGVHVLVDEVYLDAAEGQPRTSAASLGDPFIVTSSLTKSYGLAGLRCGWVIGSPDIIRRVRRARDLVDGVGAFPAEVLSVVAFDHLDALQRRSRALLEGNLALVRAFMATRRDLACVDPSGGTVCFPRLVSEPDAARFVRLLLERYETAVVPGQFFGAPRHVRLSFGGDRETLAQGLRAIGAALDDLGTG